MAGQNRNFSLLSYVFFFLGTIGEIILLPLKIFSKGIPAALKYIQYSLEDLSLLQLTAKRRAQFLFSSKKKRKRRKTKPSEPIPNLLNELRILTRMIKFICFKCITWVRVEMSLLLLSLHWRIQQSRKKQTTTKKTRLPDNNIVFAPPSVRIKPSKLLMVLQTASLILIGSLVMLCITIGMELSSFLRSLPNPTLLSKRDIPLTTKLYDRNGILLYEFFMDEDRTLIPLSNIPEHMKQATIAIEDSEFYSHQGFSIRGILRAARETYLHDNRQGGSTITQQLIKSALLTPEITLRRKMKEIILAFWAERMYTKNQILEMYLNQVPYGGTAWGIESAAQTFFGKSARDLSLAEAALLAGLPQAPSEYSPFGPNQERAKQRQNEVLQQMVRNGFITQQQANEAAQEELVFASPRIPIRAPHFVLYARDWLFKRYGERHVLQGGLQIRTTLDARLQDVVQQIVATEIEKLKPLSVGNGAVLVTDPRNGEILAMVGSKDYFNTAEDGNVNVTTALRQPGSSIKVVTYTAALERGFTAATLLDDSPVRYNIPGQPPYTPVNYDGRWRGLVPLRYALGNSYNIPAVRTLERISVQAMIEKGQQMGIDTWSDPSRFGLSLSLGGGEVTMIDMAEVYGTLANQGIRKDVTPIISISEADGTLTQEGNTTLPIQATTPEIAWIMSNILSDNTARTQAFGPNSQLVIPGKTVSVKTGTTNEKRDNWTVGYTPSAVVTVWVGNNDNRPMNPVLTSGVTGASPIWQQVMKEVIKDKPDETHPKPEAVIALPCYLNRQEYFVRGTEPSNGRCQTWPIPTATPTP